MKRVYLNLKDYVYNHTLCINCFKRCYYSNDENKPEFPYSEIEDTENPKWLYLIFIDY